MGCSGWISPGFGGFVGLRCCAESLGGLFGSFLANVWDLFFSYFSSFLDVFGYFRMDEGDWIRFFGILGS